MQIKFQSTSPTLLFSRGAQRPAKVGSVCWATLVVYFVALPAACAAEPYVPRHDDEVLERLPRVFLASADELAQLRRQLAAEPTNTDLASQIASRYLQMGNQAGDPRFFGYARATLSPWWNAKRPPSSILRLRAKLKEKDHLYDEALADLSVLLDKDPANTQAWVETANIYRVQGKYEESLRACEALQKIDGPDRALFCRLPIQAVTGEAEAAYEELNALMQKATTRWPTAVPWVTTMQAKVAVALGREDEAEQHFLAGLKADPMDFYLIREYSDYLLDHDRHDEALAFTREHVNNDNGILLRTAIAARRSGETELASEWTARLENRFEEIRLRGNQPHGRFEARYLLELKEDPQRALVVALANWEKQKESRDTRNVLEAAVAAGDREAAQPVIDFLSMHNTENMAIERLISHLESLQ